MQSSFSRYEMCTSLPSMMTAVINPDSNFLSALSASRDACSRSPSPLTPSPSRQARGMRLFRAIGRRLVRRSAEDVASSADDADSRSSSSDSSSSGKNRDGVGSSSADSSSGYRSSSLHHLSSSSSDAGSGSDSSGQRQHSSSAESVRKILQTLTLRSRSCTVSGGGGGPKDGGGKKGGKNKAPKRILRSPVTYTYVKGLSGLPTQRVPRNPRRVHTSSSCACNVQHIVGLHR